MPEKLSFRDMEGEDLATTVLTCEGDIKDPTFPFKLQLLVSKLQRLISDEKKPIKVTKVEPWNSVRVTFNIPLEAAQRLRQLAERGDSVLRELGILSVQIEGDQVITLTLASQYSEPQEIVLRKTSDEQGDVASVSFNLPSSEPVPGPSSAEPAHKNISQFLGHIVGGAPAAAAAAVANSATRLERPPSPRLETSVSFRSPNVIAPTSSGPIPFPPAAVITTTAAVPSSSRVSPNVSVKPQTGFGPFPFASMTHAMNTKHNATSPQYQPVIHVQSGNPRISFTTSASQLTNVIRNTSSSSVIASTSVSPKTSTSSLQKAPRTAANPAFNNSAVSRVTTPNIATPTSRANVALSSPLLVNLLQSETSNVQQHNKLMPPPTQTANQPPKRKRKPRKPKEKGTEDGNVSSPSFSTSPSPPSFQVRSPSGFDPMGVLGPPLNVPLNNHPISQANSQLSNLHPMSQGQPQISTMKSPSIHPQAQGLPPVSLSSQAQGQPQVSTTRQISHQTLSAFRQTQGHRTVPNIHPQAQGQPQVHTGNLPLHTHIPVGSPQVARPPTGSLQSYGMSSSRSMPINQTRSIFASRDNNTPLVKIMDKPSKDPCLLKSSTASTSTVDSNPFPSPPSSSDGKTKHLINPFTGQLEPMPSDEDEEEEESIGSLPPFPDFEIDTSEKSQSERSLSDGGKDNNLSSDTDSGISKSITDVSQSSTETVGQDSGRGSKKDSKADSGPTASVTSSVPGEKLKLRLKLDPKTIRESKESELKEKRIKDNPQLNQKIDIAVVNVPGLKKSSTLASASSVPEPRVPPLHISLRGPNAAVVVSPRKDDSKSRYAFAKEESSSTDTPAKANQKKARSPRTSRTGDLSSTVLSLAGRTMENTEKKGKGSNQRDFKKGKDDFWNQNVKNMSGGGIVEVSEKLSANRLSSYEAYVSGSSVAQHKSSTIFALSSRDSCKSEIMTLTSCATGESVTLHTFSNSKSPLPLQVAPVSETELLPASIKNEASSTVQASVPSVERTGSTTVLDTTANPVHEKLFSHHLGSIKDNSLTSSRKSPLNMQNNYLPHSPNAPIDSKNIVQKPPTNHPSDQNQLQSASSVYVASTVPLSSRSACVNNSPTYNANDTTVHNSNVPLQISVISDSKKLSSTEGITTSAVDNASGHENDQTNKTIHQCNTHSKVISSAESAKDPATVDKSVQNKNTVHKNESLQNSTVINEVQNVSNVNSDSTANNSEKSRTEVQNIKNKKPEIIINKITNSVTAINAETEKCKQMVFTNHTDSCDLSVSCYTPLPKKELVKEATGSPDQGVCIVEVKNPPIAQIITVDSLPIQSHVIEVPSSMQMQTSPAVPRILAKTSGLSAAIEVASIPPLVAASVASRTVTTASSFLPARNDLALQQESRDVLTIADSSRESPEMRLSAPSVIHSQQNHHHVKLSLVPRAPPLANHIDSLQQETPSSSAKGSPERRSSTPKNSPEQHSLSSTPSEESSMDSIDEERKRCMQLSEIPTSTPGPPTAERLMANIETPTMAEHLMTTSAEPPSVAERLMAKSTEPPSVAEKQVSLTGFLPTTPNVSSVEALGEKNEKQYQKSNTRDVTPVTSGSEPRSNILASLPSPLPVKSTSTPDSTNQLDKKDSQRKESETSQVISSSSSKTDAPCKESIIENHITQSSESFASTDQSLIHSKNNAIVLTNEPITSDSSTSQLIAVEEVGVPLSIETKTLPSRTEIRREMTNTDTIQVISTSSNSAVASLLSPVKYLSSDVSSQKFKLIFKGSNQRSSLSGNNSPTSLVVPLNSSKSVPIKLVTLPGGTSALSVRSTSNPNIVEIIGPKSSSSQNSPSSSNPHSSSPVRLVVSKVTPGLSGTNQGGNANMRNRVVVKSVVVTSTSPSIKLVSANTVCATTPVSSSLRATTTSSPRLSNFVSSVTPNFLPAHNPKLPVVEEELKLTSVENSTMQSSVVVCPSDQRTISECITSQNLKQVISDNSFCKNLFNTTTSVTSTQGSSLTVNSTKNSKDAILRNSSVSGTASKPPVTPDADNISSKKCINEVSTIAKCVSSTEISSSKNTNQNSCLVVKSNATSHQTHPTDIISEASICSKSTSSDSTTSESNHKFAMKNCRSSESPTQDTVRKQSAVRVTTSVNKCDQSDTKTIIKLEATNSCNIKLDVSDTTSNQNKTKQISETSEKIATHPEEIISDDTKSKKMTDSAITAVPSDISCNKPASPSVKPCSSVDSTQCSETKNVIKLEPMTVEVDSNVNHYIDDSSNSQRLEDPGIVENEIVLASNVEISASVEISGIECDGLTLNQTHSTESLHNSICDEEEAKEAVIKSEDSNDSKSDANTADRQLIRPLSEQREDNKALCCSVTSDSSSDRKDSKIIIEDSQLEISLVYTKPLKRKCSENAAELIKACMGVEDGPTKRGVVAKPKTAAEDGLNEKVAVEGDKIVEENVRMSLRIRREDSVLKKSKGPRLNSDCSSDEEITLSELVTKSRMRDKPAVRGRVNVKESLVEPNNLRPGRRRSGSNESRNSEDVKLRIPREIKREIKKEEVAKKVPERTKRGLAKAQEQVVVSKVGIQRSGRIRDQEVKPNSINNNKEETNSIGAKRKTRGTTETQEVLVQMKRRRYSKDGHR